MSYQTFAYELSNFCLYECADDDDHGGQGSPILYIQTPDRPLQQLLLVIIPKCFATVQVFRVSSFIQCMKQAGLELARSI